MKTRSPITTHILDLSSGKPATQVLVKLERQSGENWSEIARSQTDDDGRAENLLAKEHLIEKGFYRLTFESGKYYAARKVKTYYPSVQITFQIDDEGGHHHVPLLMSPFGFSTYRGS